jgi:hypothetical protein
MAEPPALLHVIVHEARDISASVSSSLKLSDLSVTLKVSGEKVKSKSTKSHRNPVWNSEHLLTIKAPKKDILVVEITEKGLLQKKKKIGYLSIQLCELNNGKVSDKWYKLAGAMRGEIRLGLNAINFGISTKQKFELVTPAPVLKEIKVIQYKPPSPERLQNTNPPKLIPYPLEKKQHQGTRQTKDAGMQIRKYTSQSSTYPSNPLAYRMYK